MSEHAKRFKQDGRYNVFLKNIKAWVLIDFRSNKKAVRARYCNMYHFRYSDDYTTFVVQQPDGTQYPVTPYTTKVCLSACAVPYVNLYLGGKIQNYLINSR